MRTKRGLPFVCTKYMNVLLESVIARVQRDQKVAICHFLWMGNHPHIIIRAKDSLECTRFYGEVQKQLTESVKRLIGAKHLSLWKKNGTSVIQYGDTDGVVERIAYLYANPARAGLVDTISEYPGLSTWRYFLQQDNSLDAKYIKNCPWVRQPSISALPKPSLTIQQDRFFTASLLHQAKQEHELVIEPNAWMRSFDVEDEEEVCEVNRKVSERLEEFESEAREERQEKGWDVKGARRLVTEPLDLQYESQSDSVKIVVYALCKEVRIAMLEAYREFCDSCQECYLRWRQGDYSVIWPPGAFIPPMPPAQNVFA